MEIKMESHLNKTNKYRQLTLTVALALASVTLVFGQLGTENLVQAQPAQISFQSPAAASAALDKAVNNADYAYIEKILGVNRKSLLGTGDKDRDEIASEAFVAKYQEMNRWVAMTDGSQILYIGADNFAFPVPLAKDSSGQWYFDGVAGDQELRARGIGRNELLTIDACSALASAQELYFVNDESPAYAQRIISNAGAKDGLYWPASESEPASPLAGLEELPSSSLATPSPDGALVIDGYTLRILTAQGDRAPGGSASYIVDGKMTGGFAILATPVKYAETGIMTFMTGPDGTVYERDFGPDTAKRTSSLQAFDPTTDWAPVE
jgi:hypothetical protein